MASIVMQFMCFVLLLFLQNSYGDDPQPQQIHLASTGKVIKQESRLFLTTLFMTRHDACHQPLIWFLYAYLLGISHSFLCSLTLLRLKKQKSEKLPLIVLSLCDSKLCDSKYYITCIKSWVLLSSQSFSFLKCLVCFCPVHKYLSLY